MVGYNGSKPNGGYAGYLLGNNPPAKSNIYAETMSGGRPSGIKNRSGHAAGGKRTGAGRPSAEALQKRAEEVNAETDRQKRRKQEKQAQRSANGEEEERKRKEVQKRQEKEALNLIRKMAFDQRVRDDRYGTLTTPPLLYDDEEEDSTFDITPADPATHDDPALDAADGDDDDEEAESSSKEREKNM
eukprot:scaffold304680_cov71-Attheya_sp.AAC.1